MSDQSLGWSPNDTPAIMPQADAHLGWGEHDTPVLDAVSNRSSDASQPDQGNIITRTWDRIKGKQDPAYADVPAFHQVPWAPEVERADAIASLTGAGQEARANMIQKAMGDSFVNRFKDANGYDVFEYKDGLTGQTKRVYPSKPGLDMGDVERGVLGSVPYVVGGGVMGNLLKGTPAVVSALGQAGAAGVVNGADQIGRIVAGSGENYNPKETGMAMGMGGIAQAIPSQAVAPIAGGLYGLYDATTRPGSTNSDVGLETGLGAAAGFAVSALARRMLGMAPGLYVNNGVLTKRGEEVAKAAGMNPADVQGSLADELGKTYAATRDAAQAGIAAQSKTGIPLTLGQRTKSPADMVKEDQMRWGIRGPEPKSVIDQFDKQQMQAIEDAAYGGIKGAPQANGAPPVPLRQGVGEAINPALGANPKVPPQDLGQSIQSGLQAAREGGRQAENAAWENVGPLAPTPEALAVLPDAMKPAFDGVPIDPVVTPVSHKIAQYIQAFASGEKQAPEFAAIGQGSAPTDINTVRQAIGKMVSGAATPADRTLAGNLYSSFNDWIDTAASQKLLSGDPASAAAMVAARGISAEVKGLFEPKSYGRLLPAGNIIQKAMATDSPEGVINTLVGQPTSMIKEGSVQALSNIKQVLLRYSPDKQAGAQTWSDLGFAYWNRVVQDAKGNMASPQMIANNIEQMFNRQKSVLNVLYTPRQQILMKQLAEECRAVAWRPPPSRTNASNSAFAGGVMIKDALSAVWDALGLNTRLGKAIVGAASKNPITKFAADAWQKAGADRAVNQGVTEVLPTVGPYSSAIFGATRNLRDDSERP